MAKVYLICLLLCGVAYADQVNCVKWKDSNGNTVGTYCRPFSVAAGTGIHFSDNGQGVITITGTSTVASAGGSDTQVNFNSSGALAGSSGLTFNNSTSTLTATHVTGLDNKPYIDVVRDCGLVGNGVTDDYATVQACLNLFPEHVFYFPPTKTDGSCSYMFSATLKPTGAGTTILGGSAGYSNGNTTQGGTTLCWAAGVTGIELDLTGQNCSGCNIRDISMYGSASTNHLATPTLLNMPSGANLPLFNRTITSIQRATNVLTVNTSKVAGIEGLTQQVGSTVKISGVVSDTTMNGNCVIATLVAGSGSATNPTQFTCAQNGSDLGPFVEGKVSLPTTGASAADGILLCTNFATIIHVVIANFGRHGINADSSSADGNCPTPFSDDLILRDSTLIGNQADGYLCNGTDCNAHLLSGNSVYYNLLWGLEDQSSLGNTHIGNQLSNGGHLWASSTVPATKAISTIARTLTGGISQVSVVLSVADTNIKLGSCVVIAGVTDTSFNTTSGQCFFVNSFTDSKHYGYEQPGAPADASSSSGTSRMAKFGEAYLSSGVDDGAQKVGTQSGVAQATIVNQYVEGGQNCKWSVITLIIGGANTPGCVATQDWIGAFISTNGTTAGRATNISNFTNEFDGNYTVSYRSGKTADFNITTNFNNHSGTMGWRRITTPGASGYSDQFFDSSSLRRTYYDATTVRINSESSGAVSINKDADSGTGGFDVCDGAHVPTCITLNSATATTVGAAGAASALPANPTGYLIFKVGSTNFKIPYYAN